MRIALIVHDSHIEQIDKRLKVCETRSGFIREAIEAYCRVRPLTVAAASVASEAVVGRVGVCYYCKVDRHSECIVVPSSEGKKRTGDNTVDVCDCGVCAADGAGKGGSL